MAMKKKFMCLLVLAVVSMYSTGFAETLEEWGVRSLTVQAGIDNDAPLAETTWAGTHNSFANADDDDFIDLNQSMSLTDQLNNGVREMVFDVHYDKVSVFGSKRLRLCHNNLGYGGCISNITGERRFREGLKDIRDWVNNGNNDQVVLLKLELVDDASDKTNKIQGEIEDYLGNLMYLTSDTAIYGQYGSNNCTELPVESLTKTDVLEAGKNIILFTSDGCLSDGGLNNYVFYAGSKVVDESSVGDVSDRTDKYETLIRCKDGTTKQGSNSVKMKPGNVEAYMDAGLNIFEVYGYGADGSDWKKEGEYPVSAVDMVWSWDEYEPLGSDSCANISSSSGKFKVQSCSTGKYAACRKRFESDGSKAHNEWMITGAQVTFANAESVCMSESGDQYFFATPRNKTELNELISVRNENSLQNEDILINYTNVSGTWIADIGESEN